jgi:hypothetical protein
LVGEVKWTNKLSVDEINASLSQKCLNIPFSKEKKVIKAIFGKVTPVGSHPEIFLFDPDDVVSAFQE